MAVMNRGFELTPDGDLATETVDGVIRFKVIEGLREVEQALAIRMQTHRGEMTLHTQAGLPIAEMMRLRNEDFVAAMVRDTILQDPRIKSVERVLVTPDQSSRAMDVLATVVTVDELRGNVQVSV